MPLQLHSQGGAKLKCSAAVDEVLGRCAAAILRSFSPPVLQFFCGSWCRQNDICGRGLADSC